MFDDYLFADDEILAQFEDSLNNKGNSKRDKIISVRVHGRELRSLVNSALLSGPLRHVASPPRRPPLFSTCRIPLKRMRLRIKLSA